MKTKLTLSIETDLIPKAKAQARRRGVSLSAIVEQSLRDLTSDTTPSIVDRWAGRFTLAERNDSRYDTLVGKYLRPPEPWPDGEC